MSVLSSLLGGVSTLALFVVFCVCTLVFFGALLAWGICAAAKRGDGASEQQATQSQRPKLAAVQELRPMVERAAGEASVRAVTCGCEKCALLADRAWCDLAVFDAILAGDEHLLGVQVLELQRIEQRLARLAVPFGLEPREYEQRVARAGLN